VTDETRIAKQGTGSRVLKLLTKSSDNLRNPILNMRSQYPSNHATKIWVIILKLSPRFS
jgi:hypothetical protein